MENVIKMGDTDAERKMVVSITKALIVSVKGGLPFHRLDGDYREQNGQRIPFSKFGFQTLEEFVRSISEVKISRVGGSTMLTVADPKMDHITSLLNRQKPAKKRTRMPKRGYPFRGDYGRPGSRVGAMPRPGGFSSRSAPCTSRRPVGGGADNYHRPPQQLPRAAMEMSSYDSSQSRERGHGDGPHLEHNNFYSRCPSTSDQNQTNSNNRRAVIQPEPVAYSDTHSIRQGQGFVEYIPWGNEAPESPEVSSSQNVERKTSEDESHDNRGPKQKSHLLESYSNFLVKIKEEQASKKSGRESGADTKVEGTPSRTNGCESPSHRTVPIHHKNGDLSERNSSRTSHVESAGRGRGNGKLVEQPTSHVAVAEYNGFSRQSAPQDRIINDVPAGPSHELYNERTSQNPNYASKGQQEARDPANRTVEYVEYERTQNGLTGVLTITIANDYRTGDEDDDDGWLDYDEDEQDDDGWLDYDEDEQDEDSCVTYNKLVLRPKFRNHQLIGDDFLLHFANHIDEPCQETGGFLTECGLCISGQTVLSCVNDIHSTKILSDRVILLVGAVDIIQGMDFSTLKLRMIALLTELLMKDIQHMYICTIPPLTNLCSEAAYIRNYINKWIKSLQSDTMDIIDLESEPFVDKDNQLCAAYFEMEDIRTVNPLSPPVHLTMWNTRGLEAVRMLIQRCLW